MKTLSITFAVVCLIASTTMTAVPQLINYQGLLIEDTSGNSLSGMFDITFSLYSVDSGGSPFWTETHSGVIVEDGLFAVILGSITPFGGSKSAQHEVWIGVTFGADPEQSPRSQLISVHFAFEADYADTASYAHQSGLADTADYAARSLFSDTTDYAGRSLSSDTADYAGRALFADTSDYADNSFRADTAEVANNVINNSIGSAQLIDNNVTSQDIADSTVIGIDIAKNTIKGTHLQLGAVNSEKIADGSILNADINVSAAIDVTKISGTAVNLSSTQTITGEKQFGNRTMIINNIGISIGDNGSPSSLQLIRVERDYNTAATKIGYYSILDNQGAGTIFGVRSDVTNNGSGNRYAFYGVSGSSSNTSGATYGVYGQAFGGTGTLVYGVYGVASGSSTFKFAGYFNGDLHTTGTLSKAAGVFKIDHPLDPANKYLVHSFVESPDMMNVYNGNVTTDGNGDAVVALPDYFDALNKDFRYQLTVIGQFAQVIVSEKISGNQFSIRTDVPNVEVSWQVTGVRKDAYAEAHRIKVELDKPIAEKGLYLHPVELGLSQTKQLHYEMHQAQLLERERMASESKQKQ